MWNWQKNKRLSRKFNLASWINQLMSLKYSFFFSLYIFIYWLLLLFSFDLSICCSDCKMVCMVCVMIGFHKEINERSKLYWIWTLNCVCLCVLVSLIGLGFRFYSQSLSSCLNTLLGCTVCDRWIQFSLSVWVYIQVSQVWNAHFEVTWICDGGLDHFLVLCVWLLKEFFFSWLLSILNFFR